MSGSHVRQGGAGFTLSELPAVGFIVGLLTAIAIPNILSAQRRSRYSQTAADAKTAVPQTMVYALDKNGYPTSIQTLRNGGLAGVTTIRGGCPCNLHRTCLQGTPLGARPTPTAKARKESVNIQPLLPRTQASAGRSATHRATGRGPAPGHPDRPSSRPLPSCLRGRRPCRRGVRCPSGGRLSLTRGGVLRSRSDARARTDQRRGSS